MSIDAGKRAVDFLFEMSGPLEEVVVVFFGGEPLLNVKLISPTDGLCRRQGSDA